VSGSRKSAPPRRRAPVVLAALAAAGLIAVVAAFAARGGERAIAFNNAPPGTYAIMVRADATADTIVALPVDHEGPAIPLGSVTHLRGHNATGTVAPDGTRLALIVADEGAVSRPTASLLILDLRDGSVRRLASGLDPLQAPPWDPTSRSVAVAKTTRTDGTTTATILRAGIDGTVNTVAAFAGALGAFPFAFDPSGALWSAVIAGRGSTLYRDEGEVSALGPYVTRDWELSPDGSAVAYIETNTDEGLRYVPRVVDTGDAERFAPETQLLASGETLGVAWRPGASTPTFGVDPSTALTADEGGFDVPLAFSSDGNALAVQHWSGASYRKPGTVRLEAVTPDGRVSLEPATRFLGWTAR